jgi:RecB family exonuclease
LARQQRFGNIVHAVLENVVDKDKPLDYADMHKEYEENKFKLDPNNQISDELISVGKVIIDEFYDQNQDTTFDVYDKEHAFNFVIGNHSIIGFIDRIDVVGDRVNIIDYKTGKWEVTQKGIADNLQLGIYALAVSNIMPDKEIYAELHYLRSGRRKGHLYTKEDLENVKIKLLSLINGIIEDNNFTPTANVRACSYCDHAKSGACGTGVFRNKKAARA